MTRDDPEAYLPRLAERHLSAILAAQPVAVVMGARQTGKSTLIAHAPAADGLLRLTLDDLDTRAQALADPEGVIARADRIAIDEVQRAPDLLIAIKRAVDRDRRPGRFVLTGSANLLAMKKVQESLSGRASYVSLWPLTHGERGGFGRAGEWTALFDTPVPKGPRHCGQLMVSCPDDRWAVNKHRTKQYSRSPIRSWSPKTSVVHPETIELLRVQLPIFVLGVRNISRPLNCD